MSRQISSDNYLFSDDLKKLVGFKHPDGNEVSLAGVSDVSINSANLTTLRANILLGSSPVPAKTTPHLVTDGLMAGKIVYWTGEAFQPLNNLVINKSSATGVAARTSNNTTDATDAVIETAVIPGFLMGSNSRLRVTSLWSLDNLNSGNAAVKLLRFGIFTTPVGDQSLVTNFVGAGLLSTKTLMEVQNSGSLTAQHAFNSINYGNAGGGVSSFGLDTRTDFQFRFACSWGDNCAVSSTVNLFSYTIEIF